MLHFSLVCLSGVLDVEQWIQRFGDEIMQCFI